ncbi:hypothetical protein Rmar_1562 [Rhodothermus marinus DSM 4252]|jgi:hypothetical protein|uniref:Uncharacterized protein n=1 Tax=Rhodothermus marinus (strain ATCC 43812 / DSM 4252 / R-10) TaxID=518766 RepID=D0MIZ1_RHOM4|nr:hypothetical protein Rmar_1562 [Rhodothermus marinus DSM 4252]AEN73157.1 hypothetical protein Rhom172_1230 [Rhodothermus marinus SG0.5JP17-172]
MKRHLRILFLLGSLLAAPIFFSESPSYAQSCHEDGYCQDAGCGDNSTEPCTYMDCGNGTELCMKSKVAIRV